MMIPTLTELTRHRAQSKRERSRRRAEAMLRHPSAGLAVAHAPELEVAEGLLQRQLVEGEIDPSLYRAEMRRLALLAR
ncbi:hypothetical protein JGU71_05125 [Antrihabitans sp. YC3-6]|uniref:Uncharacterized protein n=1 Tax=Antrihabitans stalagmiti TaxID=2799499 RepID=A0A934NN18_9NOCA|nr:hypothetical protein [Antrihabitans stalagmiti]MBJ8338261.1 hypothetical protein [Antrihabitans stalagmiti]